MKLIAFMSVLATLTAPVQAAELRSIEAHSIALGGITGVAFYTLQGSNMTVVAVVAAGENAAPIRFEATLSPGGTLTISVPGVADEPAGTLHFVRHGDIVDVAATEVALN